MERDEKEELAIIRNVGYGMRDFPNNRPGLWFETRIFGGSALQCLQGEEADQVFIDAKAYSVKDLEGQPCFVVAGGGTIRFLRVANL